MRNIKFFLVISLFYAVTVFGQTSKSSEAEAEGACLAADCIEQEQSGEETISEVQQLAVTNCTALINSPACEHVPQEDRKNCSSNPQINLEDYEELDLLEQGQICAVESFSSIPDMLSFVGKNIVEQISALIGMEDDEEELSISLYLNSEFERTYENSEGMATKRATLALSQMTSSFFSLLYDAITEEFPCLNERASVKKACRYVGGSFVGAGIGAGAAIGLAKIGTLGLIIAGIGGGAYFGYTVASALISDDPVVKAAGVAAGGGAGYYIAKIAGKTVKITAGAAAGALGGGLGLFSDEELQQNIQRQIRKRLKEAEKEK